MLAMLRRRLLRLQHRIHGNEVHSASIFHQCSSKLHCRSSSSAPVQEKRLDGKVVLITGGSNGIGAATARLFASNGARLVLADIDDQAGGRLEREIGPAACRYVHCDVTQEGDVRRAVDAAVGTFGRLDVMHNNAGVIVGQAPSPSISTMEASELDFLYRVNVRGAALGVKHASRVMIEQQVRGSILCTASVSAMVAGLSFHPYTISKHALLGLVKSSAVELAHFGIRVNCITPNGVFTGLLSSVARHLRQQQIRDGAVLGSEGESDLRKILSPEDVARAALFLASDDSQYISGHSLVVDGSFSVGAGYNIFKGLQRGEIEFLP